MFPQNLKAHPSDVQKCSEIFGNIRFPTCGKSWMYRVVDAALPSNFEDVKHMYIGDSLCEKNSMVKTHLAQ